MSRVVLAAEILDHELDDARRQSESDPGNLILAMRLARLQVITAMVKTFGVGSDIACGHIPIKFESESDLDDGSSAGNELVELGRCVTAADACASERGRLEADDISGSSKQLSLPLDA
jgi:hypothetical protein